MSSDIESRSESENKRNQSRFTHQRYQLKNSTKGNSGYQYCKNEQIEQIAGAYAFPKGDELKKIVRPDPPVVDDITPEDLEDC